MKTNKTKKINGFELIDQDRYTWAREDEDGGYTFVGLRQIGDDDNFSVQTGSYNASDDIEQDPWGVFSAIWEEGYGMNPDGYNDKEDYLDYLERHYPDAELVIDKNRGRYAPTIIVNVNIFIPSAISSILLTVAPAIPATSP